jgi:hypothetical protein
LRWFSLAVCALVGSLAPMAAAAGRECADADGPPDAKPEPPPPPAPRYHIEQMTEGFWDGVYRVRCGFRVVGYFETQQEARDHACLDYATAQQRIRRATTAALDSGQPTVPPVVE